MPHSDESWGNFLRPLVYLELVPENRKNHKEESIGREVRKSGLMACCSSYMSRGESLRLSLFHPYAYPEFI